MGLVLQLFSEAVHPFPQLGDGLAVGHQLLKSAGGLLDGEVNAPDRDQHSG